MVTMREKAARNLVGALGKMAAALAEKKRLQALAVMRRVRDLDVSDIRRIGAERRAADLADQAIKLDRAAEQARGFVGA